jgi:hypothetical protein
MDSDTCPRCQQLLEQAASAIVRHIRAVGSLDTALVRGETELIPSLETAVQEASQHRENAMSEYRNHQGSEHARSASASFSSGV